MLSTITQPKKQPRNCVFAAELRAQNLEILVFLPVRKTFLTYSPSFVQIGSGLGEL